MGAKKWKYYYFKELDHIDFCQCLRIAGIELLKLKHDPKRTVWNSTDEGI